MINSFRVKTVALFIVSATSAASQSLETCHVIDEQLQRLACYDEASSYTQPNTDASEPASSTLEQSSLDIDTFQLFLDAKDYSGAIEYLGRITALANTDGLQFDVLEGLVRSSVRPIPASEVQLNLDGYRLLLTIAPSNPEYGRKVEQYERALISSQTEFFQRLVASPDEFRRITFYTHPSEPRFIDIRSRISVYLAVPEGRPPGLRVKTVYTEDSWLFVSRVEVNIDGRVSPFTSGEFERDNDTEIWEWRDEVPRDRQVALLREMADADRVTMRFTGQTYYDDKNLNETDRRIIREVLAAYDELLALESE